MSRTNAAEISRPEGPVSFEGDGEDELRAAGPEMLQQN
jgi:hypothetical protein